MLFPKPVGNTAIESFLSNTFCIISICSDLSCRWNCLSCRIRFISMLLLNNILRKNWWNALIWVTGHCNRAVVSRNRYGVEKTVDTHNILINAIQLYVCLQAI